MTPLTNADHALLKKRLHEMRLATLNEIRAEEADEEFIPPGTGHEVHANADEAEAQRLMDVHRGETQIDRTRLHDIEMALGRMAQGNYGICMACAESIPRERLLAQPAAIRCTACQGSAESQGRG